MNNEEKLRKLADKEISDLIAKLERQAEKDARKVMYKTGVVNPFLSKLKTVEYLRMLFLEMIVQYGNYLFYLQKIIKENPNRERYFELEETIKKSITELIFLGDQISKPYSQNQGLDKILGSDCKRSV